MNVYIRMMRFVEIQEGDCDRNRQFMENRSVKVLRRVMEVYLADKDDGMSKINLLFFIRSLLSFKYENYLFILIYDNKIHHWLQSNS